MYWYGISLGLYSISHLVDWLRPNVAYAVVHCCLCHVIQYTVFAAQASNLVHTCTHYPHAVGMHITYLVKIYDYSMFGSQICFFTFMPIMFEIFRLLQMLHMCLYTLWICLWSFKSQSQIFYIWQPYLSFSLCQVLKHMSYNLKFYAHT